MVGFMDIVGLVGLVNGLYLTHDADKVASPYLLYVSLTVSAVQQLHGEVQ